ncbi:alpha/beta hydrolase [Alteromonas sediminis]|uniref:Alpha/beta hydrolase n=1 Tax=Alteromonas sediminis TaxID=2259342 RepID=A0A3N5Z735_9ALTE|nr:alpha/beta hydrolase-fold protein [Alteromonas sediminis]RPJ66494.1 alpha/beta hydrolase [Alteromonas sediminis]
MNTVTMLLCTATLLMTSTAIKASEASAFHIARTQTIKIKHKEFDRDYALYIKLPEDYHKKTDSHYPVIYTTDAEWHMDLLSGVTTYIMPNVIIVGISWQQNMSETVDYGDVRAFASRFRDYSFIESDKPKVQKKYQFGKGAEHLTFIRNHIMPLVAKTFRVDPTNQTYLGYSMGAEFGAYILLAQPETFDNYILGSPSVDEKSIAYLDALEKQHTQQHASHHSNVFLSIGALEHNAMDATKQLASIIRRKGPSPRTLTGLEIINDADHTTAVPDTFTSSIKWLSTLSSN